MPTTPRTIYLWPDGSPNNPAEADQRPRLEAYAPEDVRPGAGRAAVVVLPGGGYRHRAPHEGEPFARLFCDLGLVGIVCHYRVAPHGFPAPMADAARAIRVVRDCAEELGVDAGRIGLMGFSAGGHLAATTGTQPDLHHDPEDDLVGRHSARPDRLILGYPVVSMVINYHQGSAIALLGENPSEEARRRLSNELHVTPQNPPVFLFHTADDPSVPVDNSIRFAQACLAQGVPVEMHIYQSGRHGVGLASDNPRLRSWTGLLADWLADWRPL